MKLTFFKIKLWENNWLNFIVFRNIDIFVQKLCIAVPEDFTSDSCQDIEEIQRCLQDTE